MTDVKILDNAIERAKKMGFLVDGLRIKKYTVEEYLKVFFICDLANKVKGELYTDKSLYEIIFSHSFAKAFWGEEQIVNPEHFDHMLAKWQYHLQVMVVQENPLQYLAKFLDEEEK